MSAKYFSIGGDDTHRITQAGLGTESAAAMGCGAGCRQDGPATPTTTGPGSPPTGWTPSTRRMYLHINIIRCPRCMPRYGPRSAGAVGCSGLLAPALRWYLRRRSPYRGFPGTICGPMEAIDEALGRPASVASIKTQDRQCGIGRKPRVTPVTEEDRRRWDERYTRARARHSSVRLSHLASSPPMRRHSRPRDGLLIWPVARGSARSGWRGAGWTFGDWTSLRWPSPRHEIWPSATVLATAADLMLSTSTRVCRMVHPSTSILCHKFRDRRLDQAIIERLAPGGLLAIAVLSEVGAAPGPFRAKPASYPPRSPNSTRSPTGEGEVTRGCLRERFRTMPTSRHFAAGGLERRRCLTCRVGAAVRPDTPELVWVGSGLRGSGAAATRSVPRRQLGRCC